MPFLSRHMGSAPGELGMSGRHVQPLVPARSVRICILSSIAMIAASLVTASGPADIALLIISSSVLGGSTGPVGADIAAVGGVVGAGGGADGGLHAARANTVRVPNMSRDVM